MIQMFSEMKSSRTVWKIKEAI